MPKRPSAASATSEPASKRAKSSTTPTITSAATIKSKQDKAPLSSAAQTDDDGNTFWELTPGAMRRVTVGEFKGSLFINVREYYVDKATGKQKPGSKGISLPVDQWAALVEMLPQVEAALISKGHSVPRPNYDGAAPGSGKQYDDEEEEEQEEEEGVADGEDGADQEAAGEEEEEEEVPAAKPPKPAKKEQKPKQDVSLPAKPNKPAKATKEVKKNYEATDDEDEEMPAAGSASSKLAKFMHS